MKEAGARPYRSHKFPACARCHKRRARCTIEQPGQACLLCRMHGAECSSASTQRPEASKGYFRASILSQEESLDQQSHVVGPIVARDAQIFEQYLPSSDIQDKSAALRSSVDPMVSYKPVYHATIPPRRPSPTICDCSRNRLSEWLNVLEPNADKLLTLYFENLHCAFPIMVESCILDRRRGKDQMPPTFLANIYAYVLFYWDSSQSLSLYPKPDQDYAWQIALSANLADLQKRDIATLVGTVLNIAGRPSTNLTGNATNVARTVAIAHGMGLNHDPSDWKIENHEKQVRSLAWWAILILDRWFNFSNGTPMYITSGHYDVPIPSLALLTKSRPGSVKHLRAAECYIALCHLTEVVGDILPLLYHIRSGNDAVAAQQVSKSEVHLRTWVAGLPPALHVLDFSRSRDIPGLANLQLSYLAVKMLLARIALHDISSKEPDPHPSWLLSCQAAADDVVRFALSLHPIDFRGFWLPHNSHHFTSAVTLLLRCALQTGTSEVRRSCMQNARALVDFLRRAKEESNWDLAEACLATSEHVVRRIEDALSKTKLENSPYLPPQEHYTGLSTNFGDDFTFNASESGYNGDMQLSIEELFPEIFSEFTDTALLVPFCPGNNG